MRRARDCKVGIVSGSMDAGRLMCAYIVLWASEKGKGKGKGSLIFGRGGGR